MRLTSFTPTPVMLPVHSPGTTRHSAVYTEPSKDNLHFGLKKPSPDRIIAAAAMFLSLLGASCAPSPSAQAPSAPSDTNHSRTIDGVPTLDPSQVGADPVQITPFLSAPYYRITGSTDSHVLYSLRTPDLETLDPQLLLNTTVQTAAGQLADAIMLNGLYSGNVYPNITIEPFDTEDPALQDLALNTPQVQKEIFGQSSGVMRIQVDGIDYLLHGGTVFS